MRFKIKCRIQMHAEVLTACNGVDGRTIDREIDLTAMKQIQPFTGTKQHHMGDTLWSFITKPTRHCTRRVRTHLLRCIKPCWQELLVKLSNIPATVCIWQFCHPLSHQKHPSKFYYYSSKKRPFSIYK